LKVFEDRIKEDIKNNPEQKRMLETVLNVKKSDLKKYGKL